MAKKTIDTKKTIQYVGAGLLLTWLSYKLIFKKDQSGGTSDQDININTSQLSYDPYAYKIYADGIEAAIWGTGPIANWWEDDTAIGEILLKMNNLDDVKALVSAYGRRYVGIFLNDGGNLAQMIAEYLDDSVKKQVNDQYAARGINFIW